MLLLLLQRQTLEPMLPKIVFVLPTAPIIVCDRHTDGRTEGESPTITVPFLSKWYGILYTRIICKYYKERKILRNIV